MPFNQSPDPNFLISAEELSERLNHSDQKWQLLDVREPKEVEIVHIEGFLVLPLSEFAEWSGQILTQLDPHRETIVMCHHGIRSAQMCQWLTHQGFTHVRNLIGGIDAYACTIDLAMPRY